MPIFAPATYGRAAPQMGMASAGGQQMSPNAVRQMPQGLASVNPAAPMPQMSMVPSNDPINFPAALPQQPQSPPQLNNMQAATAVTRLQNPFAPRSNPQSGGSSNRMVRGLFSQIPNSSNNTKA